MGVVANLHGGTQSHFESHGAQEVFGLCVNSSGAIAASVAFEVESGWDYERPRVRLWRSSTCQQVDSLAATHRRGIACMSFLGGRCTSSDPIDARTDSGPLSESLIPKKPSALVAASRGAASGAEENSSSELLVCVGQDDKHLVTVHRSQTGQWNDADFVCSA